MVDFIKVNGTAVRTTGFYRRLIPREDGAPLVELEIVVIVRGSIPNRSFKQLLAAPSLVIDSPHGQEWERFDATIEQASVASSGSGEAAAFRYDLTFRETPESADRRARNRPAEPAAAPAPPPPKIAAARSDDVDTGLDISDVQVTTDTAVWETALRQLKTAKSGRPEPPPEPPLTPTERTGIEAILVNLRMDALIEQLEAAGLLRPDAVEDAFTRLVKERFVAEATPVVGAQVAKRAERELLG